MAIVQTTASVTDIDKIAGMNSTAAVIDAAMAKIAGIEDNATVDVVTTLSVSTNILKYTDEDGAETDIDLSLYLDDTNLAFIQSGVVDGVTGIATFTRSDASEFTVDLSALLDDTKVTVEDSLTSEEAGDALSANMGKTLEDTKQANLESGTNIKTVNGETLLGSTDIEVQIVLESGTNIKTVNGESLLGATDIKVQVAAVEQDVTTTHTAALGETLNLDSSGGIFTVTLPSGVKNGIILVCTGDSVSTNNVTIDTTDSELIKDLDVTPELTKTLAANGLEIKFKFDGTAWRML